MHFLSSKDNKLYGPGTASYGLVTMILTLMVLITVLQVQVEAHPAQHALAAISAFGPLTVGLVSTIWLPYLPQALGVDFGTCFTVSGCNYSVLSNKVSGTIGTKTPTVGTCNGFLPAISQGKVCHSSDCQRCEPLGDSSGKPRGCLSHGGETDAPWYEICF